MNNTLKTIQSYLSVENIGFTLVCAAAVFSTSSLMTDTLLIPKQLFSTSAACIVVIALALKSIFGYKLKIDTLQWGVIITIIAGVEAIYALFQFSIYTYFHLDINVCGHFDNPAGLMALMCIALPFAMYQCQRRSSYHKLTITICVLIDAAILLSRSRTGILIAALLLFNAFLTHRKVKFVKRLITIPSLLIILLIGAYFINQGSADGRILIWRACWPLICDTPLWGNGPGAFVRLYMDYQASFLENYPPDSNFAMLADNVLVPFNEYINLYLDYGVIGLLALGGIITIVIVAYRHHPNDMKRTALTALIVLAFISLFSYPFSYPFTYVATIFCIYTICKDLITFNVTKIWCIICVSLFIVLSFIILTNTIRKIENEYLWGEAFVKKNLVIYSKLRPRLQTSPHFLYNYAYELYGYGDYDMSLKSALQCSELISHYDLELLIGDIFFKNNDFINAERHYFKAHHMCPNRFAPLICIRDTYVAKGDTISARSMNLNILIKPMKVPSKTIKLIKYKIKQDLDKELQ